MLAFARAVAVAQSRENADGRVHSAHHIRDAHANLGGHPVRITRQ